MRHEKKNSLFYSKELVPIQGPAQPQFYDAQKQDTAHQIFELYE